MTNRVAEQHEDKNSASVSNLSELAKGPGESQEWPGQKRILLLSARRSAYRCKTLPSPSWLPGSLLNDKKGVLMFLL